MTLKVERLMGGEEEPEYVETSDELMAYVVKALQRLDGSVSGTQAEVYAKLRPYMPATKSRTIKSALWKLVACEEEVVLQRISDGAGTTFTYMLVN